MDLGGHLLKNFVLFIIITFQVTSFVSAQSLEKLVPEEKYYSSDGVIETNLLDTNTEKQYLLHIFHPTENIKVTPDTYRAFIFPSRYVSMRIHGTFHDMDSLKAEKELMKFSEEYFESMPREQKIKNGYQRILGSQGNEIFLTPSARVVQDNFFASELMPISYNIFVTEAHEPDELFKLFNFITPIGAIRMYVREQGRELPIIQKLDNLGIKIPMNFNPQVQISNYWKDERANVDFFSKATEEVYKLLQNKLSYIPNDAQLIIETSEGARERLYLRMGFENILKFEEKSIKLFKDGKHQNTNTVILMISKEKFMRVLQIAMKKKNRAKRKIVKSCRAMFK